MHDKSRLKSEEVECGCISQQAVVTFKKGPGIDESSEDRRWRLIGQILSRWVLIDIEKLDDPVNLIREDRDRQ